MNVGNPDTLLPVMMPGSAELRDPQDDIGRSKSGKKKFDPRGPSSENRMLRNAPTPLTPNSLD